MAAPPAVPSRPAPIRMVATPVQPFRPGNLQLGVQALYEQALSSSEHAYILLAAAQSALLGGCADAASQQMLQPSVDASHVAAMAVLAACLSGGLNAVWLRQLERRVPGQSDGAVLMKTAADYIIAGTIANSLYLVLVPLLTAAFAGGALDDPLGGWTPEGFRSVMLLEACTFAPYNIFAFRLVPPNLRPLAAAMVSATCTVVLSAITLWPSGGA
jgi:hypothetical protein